MTRGVCLLTCCLLALTGVAGCNALLGTDGPTAIQTPTASVTPAPVPADAAFPPGLSSRGVRSPEALAAAHVRALENRSFVLAANRTVRDDEGGLRSRLSVRVALDADRTYLARAHTAGPDAPVFLGRPPARATFWSNGSVFVRRLTRDGETTYVEFDPPAGGVARWPYWTGTVPFGGEGATPGSFYRSLFQSVPTRVTGRTTTDEGVVYRLVGDRVETDRFRGVDDVRDLRLVATVTESGLVRSLSLRYVGVVDGERVRVDRSVRYRDVGETSVERPAWFDRAVGSGERERTERDDGTAGRLAQSSAGDSP